MGLQPKRSPFTSYPRTGGTSASAFQRPPRAPAPAVQRNILQARPRAGTALIVQSVAQAGRVPSVQATPRVPGRAAAVQRMESGAALNPGWYFVSGDYWYWDGTRYVYSQTQYTQWHQQFQLGNQWQSQPAQTIHTQSSPNISSHYPGSAASAAAQQPAQQLRTVRDVNEPNFPAVEPPGGLVIRDARGEEIEIPAGW
jgi:hypothetical protein